MARVDQAEAKVAGLAETVGELTARVAELEDELHAGLASFADIAERARHACRLAGLL